MIAAGEDRTIPELKGEEKEAGTITLAPCTVTYLVVRETNVAKRLGKSVIKPEIDFYIDNRGI